MIINLWWGQYTDHDLPTVTPPSFHHNSRPRRMKYAWRWSGLQTFSVVGWGGQVGWARAKIPFSLFPSLAAWVVLHLNLLNNKLFSDLIPKTVVKNISGNKQQLSCLATGSVPSLSHWVPLSLSFSLNYIHRLAHSLIFMRFKTASGIVTTVLFYYFRKLIPCNCAMAVITRSPAPLAANFWRLVALFFFILFSAAEHRMRAASKVWKNRCELRSKSKFHFSSQVYPLLYSFNMLFIHCNTLMQLFLNHHIMFSRSFRRHNDQTGDSLAGLQLTETQRVFLFLFFLGRPPPLFSNSGWVIFAKLLPWMESWRRCEWTASVMSSSSEQEPARIYPKKQT